MKNILFNLRKNLSKSRVSKPLEIKDLEKAMKSLKKEKARDPNGWINDLFKEGVAGMNLKLSMLKFFNKIKLENYIPDFMKKADIATLYKGKGVKSSLENEVFLLYPFLVA